MKLAISSSSSESSLQLQFDFDFCLFFLVLLDALKVSSFLDGLSYSILISEIVRIPCNSSMFNVERFSLSSRAEILGSNLIGRDLSTF
jgi:hypothetical protein